MSPSSLHWIIILPCWLSFLPSIDSLPLKIRIGALYEPEFKGQFLALEWAVQEINLNPDIFGSTVILVDSETVDAGDSFDAQRKVCRMTDTGIAAMFGPMSSSTSAHVQSMCTALEIPHLQWRWDPRDIRDYFSISLYPHYLTLSRAYKEAIRHWRWNRFTILYETNEGLIRVQETMKVNGRAADNPPRVNIRKLEPYSDYIMVLKELRDDGEFRFIIDCQLETVEKLLNAALKLRMITYLYHFFFTTLDLSLLDLTDYQYGDANITAYRLIDPDRDIVRNKRRSWLQRRRQGEESPLMDYFEVATETALAYDAFLLFAKALDSLSQAVMVNTASLPCDRNITWKHGVSLLNYMKAMQFEGLSGTVKYNYGDQRDFDLDLLSLKEAGLVKIGNWNENNGLNMSRETQATSSPDQATQHYRVSGHLSTTPVAERNC